MNAAARPDPYAPSGGWRALESAAAGFLALLWVLPLAYAVWAAFHPAEFTTRFALLAPLTLENFERAWAAAPFARYFLNTVLLETMVLAAQLVICVLAAYAFARFAFLGRNLLFALVLVQLMIVPDVLLVENYRTLSGLGILDTITGIVLHSDTPFTSDFECSDPLVNQLFKNVVWTQRANFLDLPTDCPQRDERFGWTGDAQVYIRTATYNAVAFL